MPRGHPNNPRTLEERFWPKVDQSGGPTACWPWTAYCARYGIVGLAGHKIGRAHRVAYELVNGPIPDGLNVLHRCDNPPCCNPAHLFLGTPADNALDRERKGRGVRRSGEANGHSKLTVNDILTIRSEIVAGTTHEVLSRRFGISVTHVSRIATRRNWAAA